MNRHLQAFIDQYKNQIILTTTIASILFIIISLIFFKSIISIDNKNIDLNKKLTDTITTIQNQRSIITEFEKRMTKLNIADHNLKLIEDTFEKTTVLLSIYHKDIAKLNQMIFKLEASNKAMKSKMYAARKLLEERM